MGSVHIAGPREVDAAVGGVVKAWPIPLLSVATGNASIIKTGEKLPLSALLFSRLLYPDGILSILSGGLETGELLSSRMRIRKTFFTGSALAGKAVAQATARSNPQVMHPHPRAWWEDPCNSVRRLRYGGYEYWADLTEIPVRFAYLALGLPRTTRLTIGLEVGVNTSGNAHPDLASGGWKDSGIGRDLGDHGVYKKRRSGL
ncbi:hypothetical protein CVT25_009571 [Psilocybe cyanescens]|uniref:Aldehyde dehydrogenase domain-containing protein n=1 Tax=Psilocybe cyanescens TaxID=93625 RepID=A0A409XVI2_PSICY|nr:hypothetical protein CVT25_009571 [Psilocybe cyanescens]